MKNADRERVLLFGDDMRIFLTVARSLGRAGKEVHAAPFDCGSPALSSRYVSYVHRLPSYPDNPPAWRASVSELLRTYAFDLLLPCCDRAILPLHLHRQDFARYAVAIPNPAAMDVLFDKDCTRRLCADLQIPTADGACVDPADTAAELAGRYGLPLALKPRRSYWFDRFDSRGQVAIVQTQAELQKRLGGLRRPSDYVIESFFRGVGVGVSVLAQDGKILHAFQHRRLREGRSGSSARVSEPVNAELQRACAKIAAHVGLTGVCMFEFRYDPQNHDWVLLETNARFWGSLPLAVSLGVDFPRFLYDLLVHQQRHPPVHYQAGVIGRNLALDGRNLFAELRHMRPRQIGAWIAGLANFLSQPVRWLTGSERSDTFVRDDLRPALLECAMLAKRLVLKPWSRETARPAGPRTEQVA